MSHISSLADLAKTIEYLESEHLVKRQEMQEEVALLFESIKPANLIKNSITDIITTPGMMDVILGTASGLVSGHISKKLFVGASSNQIRRAAGSILEVAVTAFIVRHTDKIRPLGKYLFSHLFPRDKKE